MDTDTGKIRILSVRAEVIILWNLLIIQGRVLLCVDMEHVPYQDTTRWGGQHTMKAGAGRHDHEEGWPGHDDGGPRYHEGW